MSEKPVPLRKIVPPETEDGWTNEQRRNFKAALKRLAKSGD